jgi:RecA-family ATPase
MIDGYANVTALRVATERPDPPVDLEAEQEVLGAILLKSAVAAPAVRKERLTADDFADPRHQRIFAAAMAAHERGAVADPVTLRAQFERDGDLAELGGTAYLARLAASATTVSNVGDYARVLRHLSDRRRLIALAEDMRAGAEGGTADPATLIRAAHETLGAMAEGPDRRLEFTDPATLDGIDVPPREWLVTDWIPSGQTTLLYADGATGKSLLSLQLQISTALARPWLGLDAAPCRSLGVYCEDDADELHRRAAAICEAEGARLADLTECRWLSRVGEDNALVDFSGGRMRLTPFWSEIKEAALDFKARLVVLDGAQDMFTGNENIRPEVRAYIQGATTRLARLIGGAVVQLAHPSRAGIASGNLDGGSTGWSNSCRSRLTLARPKGDDDDDQDRRILARKKANYAARDAEIEIRWCKGAFIREEALSPTVRAIRDGNADTVFLRLLDRCTEAGIFVNMASRNQAYAPRVFAARSDREGFKQHDFEASLQRLIEAGTIKLGTVTDPARRHPRQALMRAVSGAPK